MWGILSVLSDMTLYYTKNKHIHNFDEENKWNDFCHETLCFLVFEYFLFRVCFSLNEGSEIFFNWDSSFWLTLFLGYCLEFLSIIIIIPTISWGCSVWFEDSVLIGSWC